MRFGRTALPNLHYLCPPPPLCRQARVPRRPTIGHVYKNPLALQSNRPRDLLDCPVLLDVRIHEGGELSIGETRDAVVGRLCLPTHSECFPLFIAKVAEVGAKVEERKMGYR